MGEEVIRLKNIKKSYGKKEVLTDVNLSIDKGDIFGLIGKNGAGKSTMFKVILGLSEFEGGELYINGSKENLDEGRSKMGFFVGDNLFRYLNAEQNLQYYARLKKVENINEEVSRVLKLVELEGVKTKVKGFSLGMRQRLGIAVAMLGNPEILILDEPTNGLDPQGIADIRTLVRKLNAELGMTIVISSHILGELQNTAHRFGIINSGTIVKELGENELKVTGRSLRIKVDDTQRAKEVLQAAGINILEEVVETKSLEDFYFSLIGGKVHE